jgi:hypothetical protein
MLYYWNHKWAELNNITTFLGSIHCVDVKVLTCDIIDVLPSDIIDVITAALLNKSFDSFYHFKNKSTKQNVNKDQFSL